MNCFLFHDIQDSVMLPKQISTEDEVQAWHDEIDIMWVNHTRNKNALFDPPTSDHIQLWNRTDLTNSLTQYAPMNEGKINSTEHPGYIGVQSKTTLTPYPKYSRPVFIKSVFQEFNTISGRVFSVQRVRTKIPD